MVMTTMVVMMVMTMNTTSVMTSTPLSAAFSARAIVYSYGMSVPASGESRAAVHAWSGLGLGSGSESAGPRCTPR